MRCSGIRPFADNSNRNNDPPGSQKQKDVDEPEQEHELDDSLSRSFYSYPKAMLSKNLAPPMNRRTCNAAAYVLSKSRTSAESTKRKSSATAQRLRLRTLIVSPELSYCICDWFAVGTSVHAV